MAKYKIHYKKSECIGAGACEHAFPEAWFFDVETNLATLKSADAHKTDTIEELGFDEAEFEQHLEAARVCPVHVIEIFNTETGEKVYPKD